MWFILNTLQQAEQAPSTLLILKHVWPAGSSKLSQGLSTIVTFNYSFSACHHQSALPGHGRSLQPSSHWMIWSGQESRVCTSDRDHDTVQLKTCMCTCFLYLHSIYNSLRFSETRVGSWYGSKQFAQSSISTSGNWDVWLQDVCIADKSMLCHLSFWYFTGCFSFTIESDLTVMFSIDCSQYNLGLHLLILTLPS